MLSKDFFREYKEIYEEFVAEIFHERHNQALFQGNDKAIRDFVKRMMGRIVFLYFIQKKGWLAVPKGKNWGEGNHNYLYHLYKETPKEDWPYFYEKRLVPLFFDTLTDKDSESEANLLRFPYLNGGLFDKSQDENFDSIVLPYETFSRLFDTFDKYNFTVYEDSPNEHTVAVDPEMLGHIFENLLEDNKDKGAFYTPKEIVHYMCKESLKTFLYSKLPQNTTDECPKRTIAKIVEHQPLEIEETLYLRQEGKNLASHLEQVKICDPAIGSGAFPMGLLQEIYYLKITLQQLGIIPEQNDAQIKKHIIEQNIYGVDIDSGAVDIARLRFWLSLVVDEPKPQPLPNLDFKIMQGNSLLESYQGVDLSELTKIKSEKEAGAQITIFDEMIDVYRNDLSNFIKIYFNCTNLEEKIALRQEIDRNIRQQIIDQHFKVDLSNINILANSYFFLWHTYFKDVFDKGGFDIVIGNPPYVQLQKNGGKLAELYEKQGYETFARTGDIYCLFYEKAYQLLKQGGICNFITSNKWMRTGYGQATRKFFIEHTNPLILVDFAGIKVFETATVDVNILLYVKEKSSFNTWACTIKDNQLKKLSLYVRQHGGKTSFSSDESWVILSEIEQRIKAKIEAIGTPLKEWNVNIYRGILTGYNDAFIIDKAKKEEILANCQSEEERKKTDELIRPILRGRDIKRYGYEFADLYLLFIPWHFPLHQRTPEIKGASKEAEKAFENQYPAIYNHLLQYKEELSNRNKAETGIRYEWYALQRWGANYWEDFFKEKLLYSEIVREPQFFLDKNGQFFAEATTFIMTGENLEYLYHLLHSKTITYFFKTFYAGGGLGSDGYRYKKVFLEKLPIPKPILSISLEESTIENSIYKLYGFSEEEIKFIENQK